MSSIKNIPPNRTVALLTPLVFAPLAGAISVAAAQIAPGTQIDAGSLTAIFIAGATIAFGKAAQWTRGWQAQQTSHAGGPTVAVAAADDGLDDELFAEDLPASIGGEIADDADLDFDAEDEPEFDDELESMFDLDVDEDVNDDVDDELMALASAHEE